MNPTTFPEQTRVLQKPPSMSDEECSPLAIHDAVDQLISCWKPSKEDRERIARGEPLWLGVIGRGHPPVWLSTTCPFPRDPPQADPICATCPHWNDTTEERRRATQARLARRWAVARERKEPGLGDEPPTAEVAPGGDCTRFPETVYKLAHECCAEHPDRRRGITVDVEGLSVEQVRDLSRGGVGQPS